MVFQTVIGGYSSLELVSWANGTPAQLAAMLDAHYEGRINLANFWSVGDTRTVTLGAIEENDCTAAMEAQNAQLVLLNAGGKTLVTAEHGRTECAFVVGFRNCLSAIGFYSAGTQNYGNSQVRPFLNNQLYRSLPADLQPLFKYFTNVSKDYTNNVFVNTEDLLALPASINMVGAVSGSVAEEGSQFAYYTTAANRIKKRGDSTTAIEYWTRTSATSYPKLRTIQTDGALNTSGQSAGTRDANKFGIAPFGVI